MHQMDQMMYRLSLKILLGIFILRLRKNSSLRRNFVSDNQCIILSNYLADRDWMAKNTQEKPQNFKVSYYSLFLFLELQLTRP